MDNNKNATSPLRSFLLFAAILFISSAPVIIEQMNNPKRGAEKLLSRIETWKVAYDGEETANWESSDGTTAEDITARPIDGGLQIVFGPMKSMTREAFFNDKAVTTEIFRLTAKVQLPESGSNGLVFRGDNQGEYYLFLVSEASYTVEILRRENNSDLPREALISNTNIPKSIGQPHTLSVLGNGEDYYFYINGILVNGIRDSRLKGNRTGVEAFT